MDFGQELTELCAKSAKENCGKHGFILLMVKSREDPEMDCATNLVPEMAMNALMSAAVHIKKMNDDVQDLIRHIQKDRDRLESKESQTAVDGQPLSDGD